MTGAGDRWCCRDLWIANGWRCDVCRRHCGIANLANFDRGPFGSRRRVDSYNDQGSLIHSELEPLYCLCGWAFQENEDVYRYASCCSCHYWGCATVVRALKPFGDRWPIYYQIFKFLYVPPVQGHWTRDELVFLRNNWLWTIYSLFIKHDLHWRLRQYPQWRYGWPDVRPPRGAERSGVP
jgi:hypothetical protein